MGRSEPYVIGLDLDGVCYGFDKTSRYMLRRRIAERGDPVPQRLYEPAQDWDWYRPVITPEDWEWLWTGGVEDGLFRYGHVIQGAIEGAQALAKLGDVVIVTTRPKNAVHDTLEWLGLMFNKAPIAGINIFSHGQPKSSVTPAPHIFIDDAPHNVEELAANTAPHVGVVMFDAPWNQQAPEGGKVRRAKGWPHAVELVTTHREGQWPRD